MKLTKIFAVIAAAAIGTQAMTAAVLADFDTQKPEILSVEGHRRVDVSKNGGMPVYEWIDDDGNVIEWEKSLSLFDGADLPESYTLEDNTSITPVKNQGKNGCCWAFSTVGAVEANMKKHGYASDPDYSEEHLAYFAQISYSDKYKDGVTSDDFYKIQEENRDPADNEEITPFNAGGNSQIAANLLSIWGGPALESDYPYPVDGEKENSERVYKEADRFDSHAHLQNYMTYTFDEVTDIKQAIMKYGAVTYEFYTGVPENTPLYYCNNYDDEDHEVDHEVLLVGWDNNVSADLFSPDKPSKNGAWLAKNSWGDKWGDEGYFWISFENKSYKGTISVFDMEKTDNYDNIYLYDGAGTDATLAVPEYANTFTAKSDEAVYAAAGFIKGAGSLTATLYRCSGSELNFYMNNNLLPAEESDTFIIDRDGYYTIEFNEPVNVKAGDVYTIVMKFTGNTACVENIENGKGVVYSIDEGQSYVRAPLDNGGYEWSDVKTNVTAGEIVPGNVSVRALTKNGFVETNHKYDVNTLHSFIEAAELLNENDYESESFRSLQTQLARSKTIYDGATVGKSSIIEGYAVQLNNSLKALKRKSANTAQSVRKTADEYAKELSGEYTPSSLAKLKSAVNSAKALSDESADYEIDAAAARLEEAKANLKKAVYITTADELMALSGQTLDTDTEAVLMNNISLNAEDENNFTPINGFHGTFDGNGHIISGININRNDMQMIGMFGLIESDSVIKNLGVVNSQFTNTLDKAQRFAGGIAGICNGQIENCYSIVSTENSVILDITDPETGALIEQRVNYATGYIAGFLNAQVSFEEDGVTPKFDDEGRLMYDFAGSVRNCYGFDLTNDNPMPMYNVPGVSFENVYYYNEASYGFLCDYHIKDGAYVQEQHNYITPSNLAKLLNLNRGDDKAWFVNEIGYPGMASHLDEMYIEDGVLYSYAGTDSHVTVPAEVEYVAEGAFENAYTLDSITFAGDAPEAEKRAFGNCTAKMKYSYDASGFNEAPWIYMESIVEKPLEQYTMSAVKEANNSYTVKFSQKFSDPDKVTFINAGYDGGGRFTGLTMKELTDKELSDGIETEIASDAVKSTFMLWTDAYIPAAKAQKVGLHKGSA